MSTKLTGYVSDGCAASGMKLSSVAMMARLADFSNDEGVCWPSIETIARQIGAGMSTVRTAMARLEAEGWLTRKARRQGNCARWVLSVVRRDLGFDDSHVADSQQYGSSMQKEYASRAATTENQLLLLQNQLDAISSALGETFFLRLMMVLKR
ncbi:phage tail tape measure protein [Escherichia coli]